MFLKRCKGSFPSAYHASAVCRTKKDSPVSTCCFSNCVHFTSTFFYYKIFNNRSTLDIDKFVTFHTPPASSRNPTPFIQKPQSATICFISSFRFRSIEAWNSLPLPVQNFIYLISFKKALHNTDLSSFLYGSTFTALSDFKTIFKTVFVIMCVLASFYLFFVFCSLQRIVFFTGWA
jgi:hypothetical protein